MKKLTAN